MKLIFCFIKVITSTIFAVVLLIAIYFLVPGVKDSSPVNQYRSDITEAQGYDAAGDLMQDGSEEGNENVKLQLMPEDMGDPGRSAEYFLTPDEIAMIGEISIKDRLDGIAILNKLASDDVQKIYKIAKNGITKDELNSIRIILENSLSEEDMAMLVEIINRNKKAKEH